MKLFIAIFITLFITLAFHTGNAATSKANKVYVNKVQLADVGTIEARGKSKSDAFRQVATECFNRRVALYEAKRGPVDEQRALDFIDSCANLPY